MSNFNANPVGAQKSGGLKRLLATILNKGLQSTNLSSGIQYFGCENRLLGSKLSVLRGSTAPHACSKQPRKRCCVVADNELFVCSDWTLKTGLPHVRND